VSVGKLRSDSSRTGVYLNANNKREVRRQNEGRNENCALQKGEKNTLTQMGKEKKKKRRRENLNNETQQKKRLRNRLSIKKNRRPLLINRHGTKDELLPLVEERHRPREDK